MEETRQLMINLCSYYMENKQTLLRIRKHKDFLENYSQFQQTMCRYVWDEKFWEDIPMDIRLTHMDLHIQIVAPEDIPS